MNITVLRGYFSSTYNPPPVYNIRNSSPAVLAMLNLDDKDNSDEKLMRGRIPGSQFLIITALQRISEEAECYKRRKRRNTLDASIYRHCYMRWETRLCSCTLTAYPSQSTIEPCRAERVYDDTEIIEELLVING
ncbi:hypothetical protein E3P96_01561 [Wallemia ichthyophaga]|nr:hypothetical protein E3P96_01561 [Wallemia ichthyophaga]